MFWKSKEFGRDFKNRHFPPRSQVSARDLRHASHAVGLWDPRVRSSEGVHAARIALHTRRPRLSRSTIRAGPHPYGKNWSSAIGRCYARAGLGKIGKAKNFEWQGFYPQDESCDHDVVGLFNVRS
jgi:hypothetical protein